MCQSATTVLPPFNLLPRLGSPFSPPGLQTSEIAPTEPAELALPSTTPTTTSATSTTTTAESERAALPSPPLPNSQAQTQSSKAPPTPSSSSTEVVIPIFQLVREICDSSAAAGASITEDHADSGSSSSSSSGSIAEVEGINVSVAAQAPQMSLEERQRPRSCKRSREPSSASSSPSPTRSAPIVCGSPVALSRSSSSSVVSELSRQIANQSIKLEEIQQSLMSLKTLVLSLHTGRAPLSVCASCCTGHNPLAAAAASTNQGRRIVSHASKSIPPAVFGGDQRSTANRASPIQFQQQCPPGMGLRPASRHPSLASRSQVALPVTSRSPFVRRSSGDLSGIKRESTQSGELSPTNGHNLSHSPIAGVVVSREVLTNPNQGEEGTPVRNGEVGNISAASNTTARAEEPAPTNTNSLSIAAQRNTALPPGVWYDRVENRYVVQCQETTACGRKKRKYFGVSRYGEEGARSLAIAARVNIVEYGSAARPKESSGSEAEGGAHAASEFEGVKSEAAEDIKDKLAAMYDGLAESSSSSSRVKTDPFDVTAALTDMIGTEQFSRGLWLDGGVNADQTLVRLVAGLHQEEERNSVFNSAVEDFLAAAQKV